MTLLETYRKATAEYSAAVSELASHAGKGQADQFNKLSLATERTRRLCQTARERFDAHVDEHHC